MLPSASVRVPATTSNFGPGFDCLGAALALYNRVTVTRREAAPGDEEHPMIKEAAESFFAAAAKEPFAFDWRIEGDVPVSRGLGSSVTLRLGLVAALNRVAGSPLDRRALFALCARLEGHPDNAAPAAFGGFTVCDPSDPAALPLRFALPARLRFVLLVPAFEIRTSDARRMLPEMIPRRAAVASAGRAARIVAAFASGRPADLRALRGRFGDAAFHQGHRAPLIPCLDAVIAAGEAAGALGGFLSGSGSAICCLTFAGPERVAAAMLRASELEGARTIVAARDERGALAT